MPSQLKPLHGDSFTKFLRDSAANSRKWPGWVRGEERATASSAQTDKQGRDFGQVACPPQGEKDCDRE
jgi:hypothetical protein